MPATRTDSQRRTCRDRSPVSDRRHLARRDLRARRDRDRPRLRSHAARQLRLRGVDHGRRLHARLPQRPACGCRHPRMLRRGRRPRAASGADRLSAAAENLARDDARRQLCGELPASGGVPALVPQRVGPAGKDRRDARRTEHRDHLPHARDSMDPDRLDDQRDRSARRNRAHPEQDQHRVAHARRGDGFPHRARPRRPREPSDHVCVRALVLARRLRQRPLHRPAESARHARLRGQHHDPRARRRRRGRPRPSVDGDARRVHDRLPLFAVRRRPPGDKPSIPPVVRLRDRDRRLAAAPERAVRPGAARTRGARVRRVDPILQVAAPVVLIAAVGWVGHDLSAARQLEFENTLVNTAIVVALYVFIGNSGVISFGHVSFVAVGAYLSGILSIQASEKDFVLPSLFPFLRHAHVATVPSLALAAAIGGVYALIVGLPLMRLSGLPAGIATFAVLGITYNVLRYWEKIGPAAQALTGVQGVGVWTLTVGALVAVLVAFVYQRSRAGRMLRATREDPGAAQAAGINVYRQRLLAFTISGALAGFAGGLLMHQLGTITTDQVSLKLTFITLAMLVVGGV